MSERDDMQAAIARAAANYAETGNGWLDVRCPECGSNLFLLSDEQSCACLDCDWDSRVTEAERDTLRARLNAATNPTPGTPTPAQDP